MKKLLCRFVLLVTIVALYSNPVFGQQETKKGECGEYSDTFDIFNVDRWQDVLIYSRAQGIVTVDEGQLVLRAPENEPTEIEVYSLFTFDGDFDIQADYDISNQDGSNLCRLNSGLVVQTLSDEKSYKCYVALRPKKGLVFLIRLDRFGEENVERHKGGPAHQYGKIRIVRKNTILSFSTFGDDNKWRKVYTFQESCKEKLRIRFKLQTSGDEETGKTCPATVKFDNFIVNSCDIIVQE